MHDTVSTATVSTATLSSEQQPTAGLGSVGFQALLWTQFFTALNDNIFRWLVIGIGKGHEEINHGFLLMAGTVAFVLPYLFLAAPAGYLADRYRKRSVILACKVAEIVIMLLGVGAILAGALPSVWAIGLLLAVLTCMGAQAALFSPSKTSCIPEILHPSKISKANGLFGLMTVAATVLGTGVGSKLADLTHPKGMQDWWLSAAVLIGVAALGTLTSWFIPTTPAGDPKRKFPWDAVRQTQRDVQTLASNLPLLRVALGIAFFYGIGTLAQLNIDQLAMEGGGRTESDKTPLLLALIFGVCTGNILAGLWSGDHVELGLLPLGAAGMALFSLLFFTVPTSLFVASSGFTVGAAWASVLLFALGAASGLFCVPLEAYLQHRSSRATRGSILAASNFLTFGMILIASILYMLLRLPLLAGTSGKLYPIFTAPQIFMVAGLLTIPVFFYILWLIPQATVRFLFWLATMTLYRIRIHGKENLPREGGALLVANHVSWMDGMALLVSSSRPIRFIAWGGNIKNGVVRWLAETFQIIPIDPTKPKQIVASLKTAREALKNGELVCIFPEGGITRTGQVQGFRPGLMRILDGAGAPVIPVYLDQLWGSIFSFERGKFFWKLPKRWPYPISIFFGKPVENPADLHAVRQSVVTLGASAVKRRSANYPILTRLFIRSCKRQLRRSKAADSLGSDVNGGQMLLRSLILRRLLRRDAIRPDEKYVGVLLPPSVPGFIANMSLALDRRIAVNLNYTVSSDVMNQCIKMAGIKHVLTSRSFMSKMNFKLDAEIIYLEDFKTKPTLADKIAGAVGTYVLPAFALEAALGLGSVKPDDTATIIFTSGSTGTPKGVELTYANVMHNVEAIEQCVHLKNTDTLIGILPFFHSFGYTVTLWTVAVLDVKGAYHFSPLDARQIGKLVKEHSATILLSTPTFLRSYLRRIEKEEFATLDVVVVGAEKMPIELAQAFEEKFGVRPIEGYGTTELSPLASVNIPPSRAFDNFQISRKEGSVGRPVPGVSAKVTNLDTGEECKAGEAGMLWITGPNVMKGYLDQPEKTAEVIKDGWYQTGDIAFIDDDGFIHITGRQSRFSKIGGEMVPHIRIEEEINKFLAANGAEGDSLWAAVTSVPDEKRGERLVVLHTKVAKTPGEINKGLSEAGLPNLFIPGEDSYLEVEKLPMLGTGKLDLSGLKQAAKAKFAAG